MTHARARVVIFWWLLMSLLSRNLKEEMDEDCFGSSGKLFHALIVDGKKELMRYTFVRARRVCMSSAFRRL